LRVISHPNPPRTTANLAILDVVLSIATAGIEGDGILFAAVRTNDGPDCVSGAIAEGKFFVEVVKEIDHRARVTNVDATTSYYTWKVNLALDGVATCRFNCR
jgi:hypothetical protein